MFFIVKDGTRQKHHKPQKQEGDKTHQFTVHNMYVRI